MIIGIVKSTDIHTDRQTDRHSLFPSVRIRHEILFEHITYLHDKVNYKETFF